MRRPARKDAARGHNVFRADLFGLLMRGLAHLGVEDDLDDPAAVSEIDENQPAVIAPPLHPSDQDQLLPDAI